MKSGPVLMEAEVLFLACPSKAVRSLSESIRLHLKEAWQLKLALVMCKGWSWIHSRPLSIYWLNRFRISPVVFCLGRPMPEKLLRVSRLRWSWGFRRKSKMLSAINRPLVMNLFVSTDQQMFVGLNWGGDEEYLCDWCWALRRSPRRRQRESSLSNSLALRDDPA